MTAPARPDDCIFCKIIDGNLPAEVVHADESCVAFRDLSPQAPTHVLIVPRSHYANAAELAAGEPATAVHLFDAAREIAHQEGVDEGYRLVFNTGAAAGQTVFHAHLHLLGGAPMAEGRLA